MIFYILGHVFHYLQGSLGGEAKGRLIYKRLDVRKKPKTNPKKQTPPHTQTHFINNVCNVYMIYMFIAPVDLLLRFESQTLSLNAYLRNQESLLENVSSYIYFLLNHPPP